MRRCLCANVDVTVDDVDVTIDDDDVTFTRDGLKLHPELRPRAGHAHTRVLVAMYARADFKMQRNSVRSFRCQTGLHFRMFGCIFYHLHSISFVDSLHSTHLFNSRDSSWKLRDRLNCADCKPFTHDKHGFLATHQTELHQDVRQESGC